MQRRRVSCPGRKGVSVLVKTIFDVAALAGVSKSTVSRVINGSGSIKESTRRKVEKAMAELNYVPNQLAQGIRTGRTRTIALMVPETMNLFYNELLYKIESIARQKDYMVFLCNCGIDTTVATQYITGLRQRNVDGLIYCFYRDNDVTDELYHISSELPVVFLDNPLGNHLNTSYVSSDGLTDIAEIVHYHRQTNAKSIAFIGISDICNITYRYMGYKAGLAACGYEFDPDLVCMMDYEQVQESHFKLGYSAAEKLMQGARKPDAIIAGTDMLAIGAMRYLQEKGYDIPGQVAITGYDNIHLSSMISPPLSTISQSIERIAQETMDILLHKIEIDNSYNRSYQARSTFIKRGSTR